MKRVWKNFLGENCTCQRPRAKKVWTVLKGERKTSVWIDKRGTAWVGDVAGEIVVV